MPALFSFDVEEHHRIEAATGIDCSPSLRDEYARRMEDCTRWLLDCLARNNARATFFIVGEIARSHPKLIADVAQAGHEVASHGWDHRRVHRFTPKEFAADCRQVKDALEQASGQAVVGYRAPTFSVMRETAWAIDELVDAGFQYDSSIFPVRHDRYGVPDAPRVPFRVRGIQQSILELPPVTYRVAGMNLPAAGGGYFRLFPPAILRAGVRQALAEPTESAVLYFHPWEFDPDQPKLPLKKLSRWRTYVGIGRSRGRLSKLIGRFGSGRMIDSAQRLQSKKLPEFDLGNRSPRPDGLG